MLNGDGLRVVLWLAGCNHHCDQCQNPITWDPNGGLLVDKSVIDEVETELKKDYISGLTLSGGDPLHPSNREDVYDLVRNIKKKFPDKDIWMYTGYTWEDITYNLLGDICLNIIKYIDVLVDGQFVNDLKDNNYKWAGSSNQRVIDVQKSISKGEVVLR
jgi:anaerobic ribonucleoside-triphosphate reductase activating protein